MSGESSQSESSQLPQRPEIAVYFQSMAAEHIGGPIGELVKILAAGTLDPKAMDAYLKHHGLARENWYRRQVTDLGLGFIEHCLGGGALTPVQLGDLHALNAFLGLDDGAYFRLRPAEVAAILGSQMDCILEDAEISKEEELYQVDLQSAFGLGYDQYLALTRSAFERAYSELQMLASGRGASAERAKHNLKAIEPLYHLVTLRPRTRGALY